MAKWNEAEIDEIIASVERTVEQVELLGKSQKPKSVSLNASAQGGPMKKDEKDGKKDDQPSDSAAPDAAPSADAASAPPAAQDSAAPAADAAPAPSESANPQDPAAQGGAPDQAGQPGEQQLEQPELSDEELHEVYGSMPHEELERHFMVIRSLLQDAYAQQDGSAGAAAGGPAPEAQGAAPAPQMGKEEKKDEGKDAPMDKAEKAKLESLEKSNTELKSQIELLAKAIEVSTRPQRKSIEGIDFIRKSDAEVAGSQPANLSKSEITEKCKSLDYAKLSKADREAISSYMLDDDKAAKSHLEKLIAGGK